LIGDNTKEIPACAGLTLGVIPAQAGISVLMLIRPALARLMAARV
jgi:hypothetical protein